MKEVVVTKELLEGRTTSTERICFPALKHISLVNLQNLQRFCRGDRIQCPLLEKLEIDRCPDFRTFVSNSTDEETDLASIQPLFNDQKVAFRNLKSLNLWGCKSINKIWGHVKCRSGGVVGDHHLSSSVILTIGELPNLNLLMDFQILNSVESKKSVSSWVRFQALTVLRVEKCVEMEYLFTPSTAKSLRLLKVMVISECQIKREIIATDDDDEEQQPGSSSSSSSGYYNNIVFDQLQFLVLNCLPCLTSFCSGNCALEFPKLSNLVVGNCPKVSNFCDHVTVAAPKLDTFMNTSYVGWHLKTELNSDDHVQVDYQVFKKDNVYIEEYIKEGGDKYININTTVRQLWEKFQNQVTGLTTCEENFEGAVSMEQI